MATCIPAAFAMISRPHDTAAVSQVRGLNRLSAAYPRGCSRSSSTPLVEDEAGHLHLALSPSTAGAPIGRILQQRYPVESSGIDVDLLLREAYARIY